MGSLTLSGIILGHDIERFAHLSAKYLIEIGLIRRKIPNFAIKDFAKIFPSKFIISHWFG